MSITLNGDTGITSAGSVKVDEIRDNAGTGSPSFPSGADITGGTLNPTTLQQGGSQAYVRDNILGTVSESSGVPTGAIIERGSNANGEYVKYADGTLICVTSDQNVDLSVGFAGSSIFNLPHQVIYSSAHIRANWHVAFGTGDGTRALAVVGVFSTFFGIDGSGFTSQYRMYKTATATRSYIEPFNSIVTGRWY